jgi:ankyrin repeat protein
MVDLLLAREEINMNTQQYWYHNYDKIEGRTPLHLAIMKGHYSIAQILLEHGADVNANERHGYVYDVEDPYRYYTQHWRWTPLHSAINMLEGYKTLGAFDSDAVSSIHGDSSLGQRSQTNAPINQGSTFIVRLLLLHGADVSAEAGEGKEDSDPNGDLDTDREDFTKGTGITPLLLAVTKQSKVVVQLLLQYGARQDQKALELAKEWNYSELACILEDTDANQCLAN